MINNIIFDLGNVLVGLQPTISEQKIQILLESSSLTHEEFYSKWHSFEKGQIHPDDMIEWFCKQNSTIHPLAVKDAINSLIVGFHPGIFPLLQTLREKYDLYVLSNTNALHVEYLREDVFKKYGIVQYEENYFNKVYYSNEIGHRKPEFSSFEYLISDGIAPENSIFIDDIQENVAAAKRCGFFAIQHDVQHDIRTEIWNYLNY